MKKFLFIGLLLLSSKIMAAGPRVGEVSKSVGTQKEYSSNAVYQASLTCVTSNLQNVFISSPFPAALFSIKVSSPGQGGAYYEVWDGAASTGDVVTSAFPARKVDYVNSMIAGASIYNVSFSSWLGVSNQAPPGGTPACLCIIYKVR